MRKKFLLGSLVLGVLVSVLAYQKYKSIMLPNVPDQLEQTTLFIYPESSFAQIRETLFENNQIIDSASFSWVANLMRFGDGNIKAGKYELIPSMSNRELITMLRSGAQEPVKLVLTHGWLLEDVAAKASLYIRPDSAEIMSTFLNEEYLHSIGHSYESLMSIFIPNTYEMYWTADTKAFLTRMNKEHDRFWKSHDRMAKAEALGLSPAEVYTLASIVEREVSKESEKKRVAGLYLNRINTGMRLGADPTAKFATRDFQAKRILYKHTRFDSPYNTYLYKGLPPGPISMASITSIDAVLESESHNYFYMCVDPDNPGYHLFAETITEHNRNAQRYHQYLDNLE